jgi:hypothetical protein
MAVDPEAIVSIITAAGAIGSSYAGVYFQRLRQRLRHEEPVLVEEAAAEAVSEALSEPPIQQAQASGHPVSAVVSKEEIIAGVVAAVGAQLKQSESRNRRAEFKSGMWFFVAGILATIAITLWVHPGH